VLVRACVYVWSVSACLWCGVRVCVVCACGGCVWLCVGVCCVCVFVLCAE